MQSEEDALVMHVLHTKKGWSIAQLAREFDVDWRTARRYATSPEAPTYGPRAKPAELSASQLEHVRRRLDVCEGLRATTLLRELREIGYEGSYPSLVRRVRELRGPARTTEETLRFETDPGAQLQCDWADCGAWLLGARLVKLYAFVAILGFCRMIAVRFATDTTRRTTLRLLVECLHDLGGVTAHVLTDRDPAFVVGTLSDGRAVFAPEWIDLAETLATTPRACRPYRAQTKGKVERAIREVKEDFLCWLTGRVLPEAPTTDDYDTFARRWSLDVVATRRHRTTKAIIGAAWEAERALLRPIPERILHATTATADASDTVGDRTLDTSGSVPNALSAPQGPVSSVMGAMIARAIGQRVDERALDDYEAAAR